MIRRNEVVIPVVISGRFRSEYYADIYKVRVSELPTFFLGAGPLFCPGGTSDLSPVIFSVGEGFRNGAICHGSPTSGT
jgi:hypothetical protein